jgi:cytoplasmic iron level regulating protein YaaA (DUF328/UPF0246 family)
VLILLPPSEGKATARSGRPVAMDALSLPALNPARERALAALTGLCAGPDRERARAVLGLTARQDEEVVRNAGLRAAAALPAGRVYTGVLYEALGLATLSPPARRRAQRWVLVFSGLWGALRLTDRVPPYRCPVGANLPGLGGLAPYWRPALAAALGEPGGGPILDLRSGAYAAMWTPPPARTVTVRVLHELQVDGETRRVPASHFNKATKGRMVRALVEADVRPRTPAQLVTALRDLKFTVVGEEPLAGRPHQLDVIVTEL